MIELSQRLKILLVQTKASVICMNVAPMHVTRDGIDMESQK